MARFTVLASGSSGNATLIEHQGFGLLIDCGLGPQVIAERLQQIQRSWFDIHAVILTHTHGDHWNGFTLAHLRRLKIPFYAHPRHHDALAASNHYTPLHRAGLTQHYASQQVLQIGSLRLLPISVPHDADPTYGFRIEPQEHLVQASWSIGYASDVGHVTPELLQVFSGVDTLAIEFNHDVQMQLNSKRPKLLIDRVLGPLGHLSNGDAAEFGRAIAESAGEGGFRYLVQLHLSRDCNTPRHALRAARHAWRDQPPCQIITASQFAPTTPLELTGWDQPIQPIRTARLRQSVQPRLPGLEDPDC